MILASHRNRSGPVSNRFGAIFEILGTYESPDEAQTRNVSLIHKKE